MDPNHKLDLPPAYNDVVLIEEVQLESEDLFEEEPSGSETPPPPYSATATVPPRTSGTRLPTAGRTGGDGGEGTATVPNIQPTPTLPPIQVEGEADPVLKERERIELETARILRLLVAISFMMNIPQLVTYIMELATKYLFLRSLDSQLLFTFTVCICIGLIFSILCDICLLIDIHDPSSENFRHDKFMYWVLGGFNFTLVSLLQIGPFIVCTFWKGGKYSDTKSILVLLVAFIFFCTRIFITAYGAWVIEILRKAVEGDSDDEPKSQKELEFLYHMQEATRMSRQQNQCRGGAAAAAGGRAERFPEPNGEEVRRAMQRQDDLANANA